MVKEPLCPPVSISSDHPPPFYNFSVFSVSSTMSTLASNAPTSVPSKSPSCGETQLPNKSDTVSFNSGITAWPTIPNTVTDSDGEETDEHEDVKDLTTPRSFGQETTINYSLNSPQSTDLSPVSILPTSFSTNPSKHFVVARSHSHERTGFGVPIQNQYSLTPLDTMSTEHLQPCTKSLSGGSTPKSGKPVSNISTQTPSQQLNNLFDSSPRSNINTSGPPLPFDSSSSSFSTAESLTSASTSTSQSTLTSPTSPITHRPTSPVWFSPSHRRQSAISILPLIHKTRQDPSKSTSTSSFTSLKRSGHTIRGSKRRISSLPNPTSHSTDLQRPAVSDLSETNSNPPSSLLSSQLDSEFSNSAGPDTSETSAAPTNLAHHNSKILPLRYGGAKKSQFKKPPPPAPLKVSSPPFAKLNAPVFTSTVVPVSPIPTRPVSLAALSRRTVSAEVLPLKDNDFACNEIVIMEERLKEIKAAGGINIIAELNNSSSSFSASSPAKFSASRQAPSSPSSDKINLHAEPTQVSANSSVNSASIPKQVPAVSNVASTPPMQSKRFSFFWHKKKPKSALASEPEVPDAHEVKQNMSKKRHSEPLQHVEAVQDHIFSPPKVGMSQKPSSLQFEIPSKALAPSSSPPLIPPQIPLEAVALIPSDSSITRKSLSHELDGEVERASHDAQVALLEAKIRNQAMESSLSPSSSSPNLKTSNPETAGPSSDTSGTSPNKELARHSFGARRQLSSSSLTISVPTASLPPIAASPIKSSTSDKRPTSSYTTHSRSASSVSNVAQHRFSIAPSLARNSLISQYSPVIEHAREISVLKSHSTSPEPNPLTLPPYRRASISEVSHTTTDTMAPKPIYTKPGSDAQSISIEKFRKSTHELQTLLSDMKALRHASFSGAHGTSQSNAPDASGLSSDTSSSSRATARPGPSHSTPLPSVPTFDSSTEPKNRNRDSPTSFEPATVSMIAPPSDMSSDSAKRDGTPNSSIRAMFIPTSSGSGVVNKTSSSPHLDKDLPLPPAHSSPLDGTPTRNSNLSPIYGHARAVSGDEGKFQYPLPSDESPSSPSRISVPQFPLPLPPPKSGLRQLNSKTHSHSRSNSLPVRFTDDIDTDKSNTGAPVPTKSLSAGNDDGDEDEDSDQPLHPALAELKFPSRNFSGSRAHGAPSSINTSLPLAWTASAATDDSSPSPLLDYRTAPSSPQKTPTVALAPPATFKTSSQHDSALTDLGGPPEPPFLQSSKQETQDSSNESYLTANSFTDDEDREDAKTPSRLPPFAYPETPATSQTHASPLPKRSSMIPEDVNSTPTIMAAGIQQQQLQSPFHGITTARSPVMASGVTPSDVIHPYKVRQANPSASKRVSSSPLVTSSIPDPTMPSYRNSVMLDQFTDTKLPPATGIYYDGSSSSDEGEGKSPRIVSGGTILATTKNISSTPGGEASVVKPQQQRQVSKKFSKNGSDLVSGSGVTTLLDDTENLVPNAETIIIPIEGPQKRSTRRVSSQGGASTIRPSANESGERPRQIPTRSSRDKFSGSSGGINPKKQRSSNNNTTLPGNSNPTTTTTAGASEKRPFSQQSIQELLELSQSTFKLQEIDMPPTERLLIEKFVNSLAKLSADINGDANKRPEGIRRLNNALRAIEGWI